MEIVYLKECESTQLYLKALIQSETLFVPKLVYTHKQTKGIGSRGNQWDGYADNLYFSFVIMRDMLPIDLKIQSASIYFSYLLKEVFAEHGSSVWVKWPNDFYISNEKIGGTITTLIGDYLICGIGVNLHDGSIYKGIDIAIDIDKILKLYCDKILTAPLWKEVFIKYEIEFSLSKNQIFHSDGCKVSMADAVLNDDGSIEINNQKVYSLR